MLEGTLATPGISYAPPGVDFGFHNLVEGIRGHFENVEIFGKKPQVPEKPNIGGDILLACMQGYLQSKKKKQKGGI